MNTVIRKDIDLCNGNGCPIKDTCGRYGSGPGYYVYPQYSDGDCFLFIPKSGGRKRITNKKKERDYEKVHWKKRSSGRANE